MSDDRGPRHSTGHLPEGLSEALAFYDALAEQTGQPGSGTSRDEARRQVLDRYSDWAEQLYEHFKVEDCLLGAADSPFASTKLGVDSDATATFRPANTNGVENKERVGHFELREKLGTGAFGSVWKAHDAELDRIVAVKIPRKGNLNPQETEQFLREARAAAQLKHSNIVSVHEAGREGDTVYIVSDFIEGLTLADWLSTQRPQPRDAAELCIKISEALHHAHEHGVIHRDLKPGNIMLDRALEPHIMDFGLAKREAGEIAMTIEGQILGTPAYMSPEQAKGEGHRVDRRCDVYSLGVILFELLTGERPFRGNTRMLLHQLLTEDAPSPRNFDASIPRDLETICLKCLEKDPAKRYATADDLASDLRRHLRGEPISARPIGRIERGWRYARRHPARVGMCAAIVVALLALVGVGVGLGYQGQLESANTNLSDSLAETELARAAEAKAKDELDQLLYIRRVNLALAEWHDTQPARARQLLEDCPPERRNWEWHYVNRICNPEILTLAETEQPIASVEFNLDGSRIVSQTADGILTVWDAATGRETATLQEPVYAANLATFCADVERINYVSNDQTLKVWDLTTDEVSHSLTSPIEYSPELFSLTFANGNRIESETSSIAFSRDGTRIVGGGGDEGIHVWDASTGSEVLAIPATSSIGCVAISPDGSRIICVTAPYLRYKVWDAEAGHELYSLSFSGYTGVFTRFAFSSDGTRIVGGRLEGGIHVWDASTGQEIWAISGHSIAVTSLAFSPDGRWIVSGSDDTTIKVWDASTGQLVVSLTGNVSRVSSVTFNSDSSQIASGSLDGSIRIWHPWKAQHTLLIFEKYGLGTAAFSGDGTRIVSGTPPGTHAVWDGATGQELLTFETHSRGPTAPAFSPDGTRIVIGGVDGKLKVWDIETGCETLALDGHSGPVHKVAFSQNATLIVSVGADNLVRVWDATTGDEKLTLAGHSDVVTYVGISSNGRRIVSASQDQEIRVWDVTTGELTLTLTGYSGWGSAVAISPNGRWIVSGIYSESDKLWDVGTFKMWDAETGQELFTFAGHSMYVTSIDFSPDETRIVSGSLDGAIIVWDALTGQEAITLREEAITRIGESPSVNLVAFSTDGTRIISQRAGGRITIWDTDLGR